MERFKNYVWMAAGFVILAATISAFVPGSALAQVVKAALVRDVDNPARHFMAMELNDGEGYTVPTGKILVIEEVSCLCNSAVVTLNFDGDFSAASQGTDTHRWVKYFTAPPGGAFVFTQHVRVYAKAGQRIYMQAVINPKQASQIWITGYTLDAN